MRKPSLLAAICAALLIIGSNTGCSHIEFQDAAGNKFESTQLLNIRKTGKVTVKAGDKSVTIDGMNANQTDAASLVEAAVTAGVKASKTP